MAFVLTALLYSSVGHAQQVVLVQPTESDATLSEAFNRLRGELTMHGLELSVSDESRATSSDELATLAEARGAVASVAFTQNDEQAAVSIWIGNPTVGEPMVNTISTAKNEQAPSVLALRAVEYLRVNLRDFGGGETGAVAIESERGEVAPVPPREVESEPRSEEPSPWFFHGGISGLVNRPDADFAVGPTMAGIGLQPRQWVAIRVMFAAPLFGVRRLEEDADHRATLYFLLGTGEVTFEALLGEKVRLAAGGAGGISYVDLQGNTGAIEPAKMVAAVGPTVGLSFVASPHTELRLDGQSLWFAPTVVATAGADDEVLGRPALTIRLGAVIRP